MKGVLGREVDVIPDCEELIDRRRFVGLDFDVEKEVRRGLTATCICQYSSIKRIRYVDIESRLGLVLWLLVVCGCFLCLLLIHRVFAS